ncbi:MAG: enoyl-CoA hydratase/isomerase family protein [Deltaproteobacteria bacterium]|nr:enoyl-CoA hydratase/isomerase family protein [Deltaproteobacteria bacterium]
MAEGRIRVERSGQLATITIDRPGRRNAFNRALWSELGQAAASLTERPPRAVVLTGAGDVFTAGMDVAPDNPQVAELVSAVQSNDEAPVRAMLDEIHRALDALFALPVPIIAAVNGLAYGGGAEIATRCDLRVLDADAVVCFSEVRLGLMPDLGGGVALANLVGTGRAADLILTARKLRAEEALSLGWANRVAPAGSALAVANEIAADIASNGPRAVRAALGVLRRSSGRVFEDAIADEVTTATRLIASGECSYGIAAFLSKSQPVYPDPKD